MHQGDLTTIKSLLLQAVQQPEPAREQFIATYPEASEQQKREVLSLLRARSAAPDLLDQPLSEWLPPANAPAIDQDLLSSGDVVAERYLVESVLARTPNSQVFLASDLRLAGNRVALKLIPLATDRFKEIQEGLWREIEALARLRHPSISGLIDTGIHNRYPFLVTQFYPGPTLDQWLIEHQPTAEQRLRLFLNLVSIVAAIHQAHLLHLDLKPQNIIVADEPGQEPAITILDFGIAALAGETTIHRAGTPLYAAPERSHGIATPASDVYSLAHIASAVMTSIPSYLQKTLTEALDPNPNRRPQSASELRLRLTAAIESRHRRLWLLNRLLPAAACIVLLVLAYRWTRPTAPGLHPKLREVTSLRGREIEPSFSPDGNTIYFSHQSTSKGAYEIYSVPFAGGEPKKLFRPPPGARFYQPAPSPDGEHLAFLEEHPGPTGRILYANLSTGEIRGIQDGRVHAIAFGPNPNLVYYSIHTNDFPLGQLMRFDLSTNQAETLLLPEPGYQGDIDIAISPDGKYAIFSRFRTFECADFYLVPLRPDGRASGAAIKISSLDQRLHRPQWLPGGKSWIFSAGSLTSLSPFKASLAPNPFAMAHVEPIPGLGPNLRWAATASVSNRVLFVRDREDCDIYRIALDRPSQLESFISSTSLDEEPRYSSDGKQIAFISERSSSLQGWVADRLKPASPRQSTYFELGEKAWPFWSPSGSALFFARLPKLGPEIVQANPPFEGQAPQRIFTADRTQRIAGIGVTADSVFVEITEPLPPALERWSLLTNQRQTVAPVPARYAREFFRNGQSGDRIILYGGSRANVGLTMIDNGQVRNLYPSLTRRTTFTYQNGYAYLASAIPTQGIYKVDVRTGKSTLLAKLDKNPGWGMDISPDGKELLIALYDFDDSNIVSLEYPGN